jgi:ATP-dependent exoDNAse (exonuclease V) beta subunit
MDYRIIIKSTCPHEGLKSYLLRLPEFIDHSMFEGPCSSGALSPEGSVELAEMESCALSPDNKSHISSRASQLDFVRNPGLKVKVNSLISQLAGKALQFAPSNQDRHPVLEQYFLACDRNTIAVEVPIYFIHKELGSITGHIDILHYSYGKFRILDYKPNATDEDPQAVVSQLSVYATALHYRSKVPFDNMMCAYFDEVTFHEFKPEWL